MFVSEKGLLLERIIARSGLEVNMKAALYARVSTRDKGQDVENQLRQLREFAAKQGWTIHAAYIDRSAVAARRSGHSSSR